jgi:mono/diheme cytochrome c family protein
MRARAVAALLAAMTVSGCMERVAATGPADYRDFCAACHGAGGEGDGPAAVSLDAAPSDLTGIAAANGGEFPFIAVMAKIDGYAKGEESHSGMPAFWPLLEGETVLIETDPGVMTPTPARLVALARYIESLQD